MAAPPRAWAIAAGLLLSGQARGDAGLSSALLTCEQRPGRGRVVCDLELEARAGRVVWADAVVVEAPPMARALKSRVGFREATVLTERRVRLPIGMVATSLGEGALSVRARAVICAGAGAELSCVPLVRRVAASVRVGPIGAR